jgi:ubiquitin-protein ligase
VPILGCSARIMPKEYNKTRSMLPPSIRDATIAIRFNGEQPCYCRAFVTGPVDTPYFGGVFLFDVFFPKDYPNVPPQVQFLNTAGGTERFHPNIYADGKVCVSLLGTYEGHDVEKWDPVKSCLGQVLVSIQSLILGEYHPGAIGRHITVDGRQVSIEDYFSYRLATLRHAITAVLQASRGVGEYASITPELAPLIREHFRANRRRILLVLQSDLRALSTLKKVELLEKFKKEVGKVFSEFEML